MRSEATDVKSTLLEIEEWLDKLMQLTEEVDLVICFQMDSVDNTKVGQVVGGASGMISTTGIGSYQK